MHHSSALSSAYPPRPRRAKAALAALAAVLLAAACTPDESLSPAPSTLHLAGFASLPAATFAEGPPSGAYLGKAPVNHVAFPFDKQPVQGFSALLKNGDGSFLAMADNGYGTLESSADFNLRVYTLRPDLKTGAGGAGTIAVLGFFELRDPDHKVTFAITNHFTDARVLTGADFDIESMQRAPDGTLWFGDEFGPSLLHTDATGKLLEAPIALPDFAFKDGREIRSPQSPWSEESSPIRVMNAFRTHARLHQNTKGLVVSPDYHLLADGDPATVVESRKTPPAGAGLIAASSEIFDLKALHTAGFTVVPYTVDAPAAMQALLKLGVDGEISDRPDLLYQAVAAFDANGDGKPGDLLEQDGLIDPAKFDAQGHRGGRDLRPENTLPAFEVALDNLMTTLELDVGITADGVPVISHDPHLQAQKCRKTSGGPYTKADEVLIKTLTFKDLQADFICDLLFRGPQQVNDPALSPVAALFKAEKGLPALYVMPGLDQLFAFVDRYVAYYTSGPGTALPEAKKRARNAARVRFNIETKVNPRAEYQDRTIAFGLFAETLARAIETAKVEERAFVQSFDFRTLLYVQEKHPKLRTVYLFGDFPKYADPTLAGSDDGTNLEGEGDKTSPWFAGLSWPYRVTQEKNPFRAKASGGFEAMALSPDGTKLYPMLEKTLQGDDDKTLRLFVFDVARRAYTGVSYGYKLDKGSSAADFILTDATHGLVIERDGTQGDLTGGKQIFAVKLGADSGLVEKKLAADLLKIPDPEKVGPTGDKGDVGLGATFAFPFQTIEAVVNLDGRRIGVMNDNNYPFSVGRHLGTGMPDDNEFIVLDLGQTLNGW
jgi:glycerophosphoryl diester phosphodiesterase